MVRPFLLPVQRLSWAYINSHERSHINRYHRLCSLKREGGLQDLALPNRRRAFDIRYGDSTPAKRRHRTDAITTVYEKPEWTCGVLWRSYHEDLSCESFGLTLTAQPRASGAGARDVDAQSYPDKEARMEIPI